MPAIFFGHGNPMNAVQRNAWTESWAAIGRTMPRPRAILCISAHWYIPETAVTAMERPRTIHDFGGFPRELFEVKYPAPGSPELATRAIELLGGNVIADDRHWGLDHGTWSVFCHVYPDADVPVIQLSIDETRPAAWHYELAQKLAPLREEGILIAGSGNLVHNLHAYSWGRETHDPLDWALRFDATARRLLKAGDDAQLVNYERLGKDAMLSAPTPDHYLPLIYCLGARYSDDNVTFPVEGFDGGSVSMLTVQFG